VIDKAIEMKYVGGVYGNQRPTEFLCLLLKLLQVQPEKEILVEYLRADEFKYLRALAAFYVRMTFRPVDVYELLEPMLRDYGKLRMRNMSGYSLTFMDEFVYSLLTMERVCDIILPRLPKRQVLEESGDIGPRKSRLLDALEGRSERGRSRSTTRTRSKSGSRSKSKSPSPSRSQSSRTPSSPNSRYISRSPSKSRSGSRSPLGSRSGSILSDGMYINVAR